MGWRIKNFNIFRVHRKIRVLGGGCHEKPMYRGDCLKWGVGLFADLRGGRLGKKQGIVFEGEGWYPSAHYAGVNEHMDSSLMPSVNERKSFYK